MPDQETWKFINTFAPWFSAFGTITAALVALHLARRSARANVRVDVRIVQLLGGGLRGERPDFMQVRAVNCGFREVVIQGPVSWLIPGQRMGWVQLPPDNPYSTKTPAKLQQGDEVMLLFPTARHGDDADSMHSWLAARRFRKLAVWRLRVGFHSSTGELLTCRLDKSMRRWLLEQVETFRAAAKDADAS